MKSPLAITKPLCAALAVGLFATNPGAFAQTPPPDQKIDDLEKQLQSLKQAVDDLRKNSAPTNEPSAGGRRGRGAQAAPPDAATNAIPDFFPRRSVDTNDPIFRIREEGMNHSQVMETLSYLSDVIGPRLTGSPNMKRANEWTRDKMESWGLTNAHLESWGPFGRGWALKRFSAQIIEPQDIPLTAFPAAWSPGFDKPIEAPVVYFDARTDADLDQYKGKLKGAVVLLSPIREVRAHFDPQATRLMETNLLTLANADAPRQGNNPLPAGFNAGGGRGQRGGRGGFGASTNGVGTNAFARFAGGQRGGRGGGGARYLSFLQKEGAALIVNPSSQGDGGTIFVMSATVPPPDPGTNAPADGGGRGGRGGFGGRISAYATNAPAIPAQMTVAVEQYNRLVRMAQAGEKMTMAVDMKVKFYDSDPMAYNTIAEIPGTDLKNEIVMLGGHMDSWQSGTGATDNGAGVAAAMEAVRIIKALDLHPRRTIRVALWSGEEEGLLGSSAYVKQHFGYYTNTADTSTSSDTTETRSPRGRTGGGGRAARGGSGDGSRKLIRGKEYDKLSAYFNLDNGAGKIRGVYLQGNEALRPIFRRWLDPFRDLDAATLTLDNTGSTDHVSFDNIGLPGFQFIQDPLEYSSRTHHSNQDVFDRVQPDDMKQASTIFAAFVYNAAMLDEKIARKPMD